MKYGSEEQCDTQTSVTPPKPLRAQQKPMPVIGYFHPTLLDAPAAQTLAAPWLELKSNAIERMGLIGPKHSHLNMVGLIRNSGWCVIEALLVRDDRID